jgi:hypothetical protein
MQSARGLALAHASDVAPRSANSRRKTAKSHRA